MSITSSDIVQIANDPLWLAHRYDPEHDAIHLLRVPKATYNEAVFLTDDYLPKNAAKLVLSRTELIAACHSTAPLHFVFHSAFCCSTLLARAFDRKGLAMSLKEPVILNDMVGWQRRGAPPNALGATLKDVIGFLARPFGSGEAVILKPSNILNSLAPTILGLRPQAQAVLLYAPLNVFLKSVAKKAMWGRLWVRDLMIGQLKDGLIQLGFDDEQYLGLTDLQVAAVTWVAQQALFARMIAHFGATRIRSLDSETLLARPADSIAALASHYHMTLSNEEVKNIVTGAAFTKHSKLGGDFGNQARLAEYQQSHQLHGDEIEKVIAWTEAVARNASVAMTLDAPLLG
jgi:hypothetical protein